MAYLADTTELTELTATIGLLRVRARENRDLPGWWYGLKIERLEARHRELEDRIAAFEAGPGATQRRRRARGAPQPELGGVCSASIS